MDGYNLTPKEAVTRLEGELARLRAQPRGNLDGLKMDADTLFEKGYEAAIFDLKHFTSPSPAEEYGDAVAELAELERDAK